MAEVANYSSVLEAMKNGAVAGAHHITGNAYKKLKKAHYNKGGELNFKAPCIFKEVVKRGVHAAEAYRIFNMGIGMVIYTDKNNVEHALAPLELLNPEIIGQVKETAPLVVNGMEIQQQAPTNCFQRREILWGLWCVVFEDCWDGFA